MQSTKRVLHNESAVLEIDLFGGAITDFHLNDGNINPLNFRFSKEQMPANNQAGAPYQGHFVCLGRWGAPSEGEIKAGMPDHGQFANMLWKVEKESVEQLKMQATGHLEGLHVDRSVTMDLHYPVYRISETVRNINPLGRLYNMVQHPTLAAPFLTNETIINCNADMGFNYTFYKDPEKNTARWPTGIAADLSLVDFSTNTKSGSSVFSFIVKREDNLGWITAYSPEHHLLLGYLWKRTDYPWINLWQDWFEDTIRFRGLEFGTTGIHQPFRQILEDGNSRVFGEKTFSFIDAGEEVSRSYISFLHKVPGDFKSVDNISMADEFIDIKTPNGDLVIKKGFEW